MKTKVFMTRWVPVGALTLALAAPFAFAQGMGQQQGRMMQNNTHPAKSATSQWNARFEKMQKIMQQVQKEKNPAKRRALMQEHLHLMMQNMGGMMRGMGMMGSGGANGHMGPQAMQGQIQHMQGQMRAMAQMMQQMLEQLSAMQGSSGH